MYLRVCTSIYLNINEYLHSYCIYEYLQICEQNIVPNLITNLNNAINMFDLINNYYFL